MADTVVVVDTGLGITTAAILALAGSAPAFIDWGVGTTAPDPTDTAMETLTGCPEVRTDATGTDSVEMTDSTNDTYRVVGTIVKTDSAAAITEVGLFNTAGTGGPPPTGGTMFLHATFSAINLEIGNSIEFTIDTKFAQG